MKSTWTVFTKAEKESDAEKILIMILSKMHRNGDNIEISPQKKSGFKISFTLDHRLEEWEHIVYECISLGQQAGYGWQLLGDISRGPSAMTNRPNVPGAEMIGWEITKKKK